MNLSIKHYYWRWVKNQFYLFIFILSLMTLARICFSYVFGSLTEIFNNLNDFKSALVLGLRYDLMPLAYINFLPFLLIHVGYFIPGKKTINYLRILILSILIFGYVFLAWLFICDYAFYSYFQDHINILFFGLFEDDTVAVLTSIWKNYNLPVWFVLIFLGHWFFIRLIKIFFSPYDFDFNTKNKSFQVIISLFVGIIVLALFARGNFTRLPLSLEDAHISSNEFINKVSLNGSLTLNRAIKIRKTFGKANANYLELYGLKDWESAYEVLFSQRPPKKKLIDALKVKTPYREDLKNNPPHVVLIIMESFGSYWNDQHSEKFNILGELDKHFKEDILFKNFLSSENGTIGSMVSVATSLPIRPGARYLSESEFMKTPLSIAGHVPYKNAGHDTNFLYGGKLGWRDLGKYLRAQGLDYLWGADEVKEYMPELSVIEQKDLGNEWGIFDEYLYSFITKRLRTSTKPQLFIVLTTSNHPPFEVPSSYKELPLELEKNLLDRITVSEELAMKRFRGLQYANQKVGEFLSNIKSSDLKDKVVVALTGDHSYWIAKGVGSDQEFKRYAVPFYLSVPERLRPENYDAHNFGSHEDIFPTLYSLTLSDQEYLKIGEDLFNEEGIAVNSSGLYANKNGAFHHGSYWKWESGYLKKTEETFELSKIRQKAESMIGITDVYLKEENARMRTDVKNDRPK